MRAQRARGFTLVEIMIAVAIIGLLASMGLPAYRHAVLRARQRERALHFQGFKRALIDEFRTTGKLPACTAQWVGPAEPGQWAPFAPKSQGQARNANGNGNGKNGCFRAIPYTIDGGTRYRWYLGIDAASSSFLLYAVGDANGDGNQAYYYLSCAPDENADCKKGGLEWAFASPGPDEQELAEIPPERRRIEY